MARSAQRTELVGEKDADVGDPLEYLHVTESAFVGENDVDVGDPLEYVLVTESALIGGPVTPLSFVASSIAYE